MKPQKNLKEVDVELPCGSKTKIFQTDLKWKTLFPYWRLNTGGYVVVTRYLDTEYGKVRQDILLSRLIVGAHKETTKQAVDHINRNKLDNRRCNLRFCTRAQNAMNAGPNKANKTGYRSVTDVGRGIKRFYAYIKYNGKQKSLGYHKTAEEAARAYDKAAKEIWGEFAYLNFP